MNSLSKIGLVVGCGWILIVLGFRNILGEKRTDVLLKNLIILGVTLVVLLMLGEFIVRFVFRDITSTGDNTSYFARRWERSNVSKNRWGFREREFKLTRPDNVYRIAVIGDSYTYGQGIPENERYTNLLEKYLNKKNNKYEVLNFGKGGANTIDEITILRDVVLKANPDFILLQWTVNDVEEHKKGQMSWQLPLSKRLHRKLHRSSAFYYVAALQYSNIQKMFKHSESTFDYFRGRLGDPESLDSQHYKQVLKEFLVQCKNEEIPLGVILFPRIANLKKAYPYDYLHNRVLQICTQEGISCIDLRYTITPYTDSSEYKKLWVNRFDAHPGSFVNSLAAERLVSIFGHIWLSESVEGTKGIIQLTNSNL